GDWSNKMVRRILSEQVPGTIKALAAIDLHTGLGPTGYGELIYLGPPGAAKDRAVKWYGPEVRDPQEGTSVSAVVTGSIADALQGALPAVPVAPIGLGVRTPPIRSVLPSLRPRH